MDNFSVISVYYRKEADWSMKDTFLLVDGNSLMHRAYHALPLMDADGIYTNAIYGFSACC